MSTDLAQLRGQLDKIDRQWLSLLAQRFRVSQQVGELKKDQGLPPIDSARETLMFGRIEAQAKSVGLNPQLAHAILRLIIDEVVKNHKAIASTS